MINKKDLDAELDLKLVNLQREVVAACSTNPTAEWLDELLEKIFIKARLEVMKLVKGGV